MAGAGYKLFQTGDVLTATEVNTYLQQQVTMVFADSAARTTALSGVLAEGMMSYLQDTNLVEVYNGSSWVNVGNTGDIEGITATSPITGGGTTGTVSVGFDFAAGSAVSLNAQSGTTYTFVLSDADQKLITADNASAQTYTIPPNSSVAFATGTIINLIQIGTGQVTISQGSGVTIASTGATATAPKTRARYSALSCVKVATDSWYVIGDIA